MKEGRHGVTSKTPENILFGAGTIHKNLKYATGTGWNFKESLVGATSGGSKLSIIPEVYDVPADGANVKTKGLRRKTGENASMEVNMLELTQDIVLASTLGEIGESEDENFILIQSKADIVEGDYWENIAFVGRTLEGKPIIAILPDALCTSGFEPEGKPKEGTIGKFTFECHADPEVDGDLDKLPWKIYYPKAA